MTDKTSELERAIAGAIDQDPGPEPVHLRTDTPLRASESDLLKAKSDAWVSE